MAAQPTRQVRLVRCPGCWNVLAEPLGFSLYQCGGCNLMLQAKNQKLGSGGTELSSHSVAEVQEDNALEEKEARCSHHDLHSVEASSDKETMSDQDINREENSKNYLCDSVEKKDSEFQRMRQDGGFVKAERILRFDGEDKDGKKCNSFLVETREKGPSSCSDQNRDYCAGMKVTELDSLSVSDYLESADISQPRNSRMVKTTNAGGLNSKLATRVSLNESLASSYLSCTEGKHSVDTLRDLAHSDLIPEVESKHESMTIHPPDHRYHAHNGSEPSYDCADIPLKKGNKTGFIKTTEMLEKDGSRANAMKSKLVRNCPMNSLHRAMRSSGYTSDTRDFVSRLPIPSRESLLNRRTIGPSSNWHNLPPLHPGFGSDEGAYSEVSKMDLLRTVYELKDQLNRMHFSEVSRTTRFHNRAISGSFNGINYDHFRPEKRTFDDPNYPSTHKLRRHGSCLCSRSNWNYSTWLPTHSSHSKSSHCAVHTDPMKPEDPMHKRIKLSRLKEKCQLLQPVAGAAPFTVCYRCSTLLQLPADFLILKKRRQKLRCNACRKVLNFCVLKGTHMVRFHPNASIPPACESDDASDSTRRRNMVGACHSGSSRDAKADYRHSFGKSSSTNAGTSAVSSSLEKKSVVKTIGSLGASSKIPKWGKSISEIKPSSNRRLYHLMGYSSPAPVLNSLGS